MAVINKNEFTKYVYNLLDGQNYNIGLHGVSKTRSNDITGKTDSDTCEDILNNGLTIYSGRSINGTVYSCGRIDSEDDIKNVNDNLKGYIYNDSDYYVVVAIPTVVTNSMGESIYIGKTNLDNRFKNKMDSTGYEISSIADTAILTDISLSGSKVPSEFILGYYKRLPDGNVDFVENPNHMSKKGNVVPYGLFKEINSNIDYALMGSKELKELLSKEYLNEEDIKALEIFYNKYANLIETMNNSVSKKLIPVLETINQRLNESKIKKVSIEYIDSLNKEEKKIDYSKFYEGLEGEELFKKEIEVIYDMRVDYFYDDDGKLIVHSDVPGEAEEFLRLFNDRGFVDRVFKYGSSFEIRNMALSMVSVTNGEILKDPNVYLNIIKYSYYALEPLNDRGLLTRDMLVNVAETSSFNQDTLYKLPEEYSEDYELICKFIDNSNEDNFGFYTPYGESNLAYPTIGNDVRSNPEFYDKLNNKIKEINEKGRNLPYFDKEKEINLVKGRSM